MAEIQSRVIVMLRSVLLPLFTSLSTGVVIIVGNYFSEKKIAIDIWFALRLFLNFLIMMTGCLLLDYLLK